MPELQLTMSEDPTGVGMTVAIGNDQCEPFRTTVVKNERAALHWFEKMKRDRPWEKDSSGDQPGKA